MNELINKIWVERYRPSKFEDLILSDKESILNFLDSPETIPSFIFYSSKPGTGKTSTAKLVAKYLEADCLTINSSFDRGIDVIRDQIKIFVTSLSSNPKIKRCVFLDEADGLTRQAQDSLRNLMEEYSSNCFFIFTANDVNKIIEPIRSRCQSFCFENPNKTDIFARLSEIAQSEEISVSDKSLQEVIDLNYPDMRKMINFLQIAKLKGETNIRNFTSEFESFRKLIKEKKIKEIYDLVYNGFEIEAFNKYYFQKLFDEYKPEHFEVIRTISLRLADNEKFWHLGVNKEIVFISNLLEIMKVI